jgi:methionyl-tRNA formyltransferase
VAIAFHDLDDSWSKKLKNAAQALGCEQLPSRNFNQADTVNRLRELVPDLILSVNNFDIIKSDLLTLPPEGIINFHNGPLPQYRGVNIPSWAIINGETRHGISWTIIDEGIDTGPVALAAPVAMDPEETAITLIGKCIAKGLANTLDPVGQKGPARYYSAKDTPNDGRIDLSWSRARIASFVRGLTFHPYPNTFVTPKIECCGRWIGVGRVKCVGDTSSPSPGTAGRLVDVSDETIVATAADGLVEFSFFSDEDGNPISFDDLYQQSSARYGTLRR